MKIQLTILLILFGINLHGQDLEFDILTQKQALYIIENKGIDSLINYISPINLVYLNEINSKVIIDKEFSIGFLEPYNDSSGTFKYNSPEITIKIAGSYNNIYAAQKLFEYYKSLHKHIKSDTIYYIYNQFDEFLRLLVFYNPKGLKETLESDYYEWEKLAQKASHKKYKTYEEVRKISDSMNYSYDNFYKLTTEDFVVDCNYKTFQIAKALNLLGHKDFNMSFLLQLKAKQTYPYIEDSIFGGFYFENPGEHILPDVYEIIELPENKYQNIKALIANPNKLKELFVQKGDVYDDAKIRYIIHDEKQTAFVKFYMDSYEVDYIIKLENDKLITYTIWAMFSSMLEDDM